MKVSPHTHCESPLTGSTLKTLVDKAKEMGRTHFAYTDNGHLSSTLKAYNLCKPSKDKDAKDYQKRELKFIPGIEVYFKDTNCPWVATSTANRCKYFTATLYCQNQTAYQELCRVSSRTDFPTVEINERTQQLWSWKDLDHISKFDVVLVIGGVHCMVGKTMLAGEAKAAVEVFNKLNGLFGKKFFVSLICEPWTKKWNSVVEISLVDGSKVSCLANDSVSTDKARRMKAIELTEKTWHTVLKTVSNGGIAKTVELGIKGAKLHKGFLPLPGGDAMLRVNKFLKALASKNGIPMLASDYAYYANKEDKIVQTMLLEGANKLQPDFYMKTQEEVVSYLKNSLGVDDGLIQSIIHNQELFISLYDKLEFKYDWRLADSGPNPLAQAMEIIKKNGRMRWDDPKYVNRLKEELTVIAKNPVKDLTPYFLPIRDVLNHYAENGQLTGPGRGSAGGSLFCYLLGITQVNPFKYDLPFNRFFSLDRIMGKELPDIDVDLEDRALLVGDDGHSGYLYGRWGNKAAQISTRTTIRLKSAVKDTNRYFKGKVEPEIEIFSKGLPTPPQGINDHQFVFGFEDGDNHILGLIEQSEDLQRYAEQRPEEWAIVSKAMGLTRAYSKHASAFVLSDIPIQDIVPTKDGNITQYEAKECEAAGLIKYDFLVIKQLKDERVCLDLINKKNGKYRSPNKPTDEVGWWHDESDSGICAECESPGKILEGGRCMDVSFPNRENCREEMVCGNCKKQFKDVKLGNLVGYFDHNGKTEYIWDLPELPEVFKSTWAGECETLFQINTKSMVPFVVEMLPNSIMDIATLLALIRPGPMDFIDEKTGRNMVEEYMMRRRGESTPDIQELADLLPETFGIIVFQEQLNKIARDLAGFPGDRAEKLRKHMAKKNMKNLMEMKPDFIAGAMKKVSAEIAEGIWERMVTFGRYGFSIIHAVEYALVTYASMFFKHFYGLEWWAAVLTNAEEQEITGKFWPYVKDIVFPPDINLSSDTMVVDYANSKIRSKLGVIRGIGEATIGPIVEGRPYKDAQHFVDMDVAGPSLAHKLIHVGVLDSLFPPRTNLIEKLKFYEDAVERKKFHDKAKKAAETGKKTRATQPKEGTVPEEYVNLHPIRDAEMRKAVLPSLPIDMFTLGKTYSKVLSSDPFRVTVVSSRGYDTILINGEQLKRLDELAGEVLEKDMYVASTCFVVKVEEFSYPKKNPTKRALKLILDADGFVKEYVLWPDYESGELRYPVELKRGKIVTVFFRKKVGRKDMNISGIVVEGTNEAQ